MKLTKRLNHIIKYSSVLAVSLLLMNGSHAQSLTIEDCQQKAEQLSPLKKQEQYIKSIDELNQQIVRTNWLPGINFQGRATYQSDVFKLPIDNPMFEVPDIPKDQYQLTLNLNQTIYDGGATRAANILENTKTTSKSAQLEVSLYQVRKVINDLYFGILSLNKSLEINQAVLKELDNQIRRGESAVKNGVLLARELKSLQKQKLSFLQQQNELKLKRGALLNILGDWIGEPLNANTVLTLPEIEKVNTSISRPELMVFSTQMQQLDAQQSILSSRYKPKLAAFATAGFGNPNQYNFFETDWSTYYMIGGELSWSPWDWNKTRKQQEILSINQQIIKTERENFEKNVNNQLIQQQSEIELLQESLSTDQELVMLQKDITETAASQFEKGVISATDYLTELNELTRTQLQYRLHQIQLVKSYLTKQNIAGTPFADR